MTSILSQKFIVQKHCVMFGGPLNISLCHNDEARKGEIK